MPIRRWTLGLAAVIAFGQEAAPFQPEVADPRKPAWELTLRGDRLDNPVDAGDSFRRTALQLRLRWSWDLDALHLEAGTRSAMGSDGNRFNAPRWDQQPSNGTQVDVAHGDLSWASARSFGTLSLGFQENGLLSSQALWDRNLRFLGAGGRVGLRDSEGLVQEAGLRASVGRVRNVLGGDMDLAAGQAVLKLDTGPWSWTAHAGRWNLSWNPGAERLRALPGADPLARQKLVLDAVGASARWNCRFPLEARWFEAKNRRTGENSEEVQATAGSRERLYWPQLSITWQRLSSTGTLYPVNGDEWWFYRRAKGHRADLSLPLPGHWLATLVYLRQRADGEDYDVTRKQIVLVKRF
ncbi:hypothetical protein GETHLI_20120 [Geothrix limicola]|uniref:Alginate export domain-containing protein n=1 Tax=Geothrix limicola TaxID=2927978 RepID=A0ABQ5QF92_9BACT|nr:hypothetical protein [Geothrix limicola]GLH73510.1 hypothetical protein GETHLI_20120 [Geothrix limicola]